MSGLDASNIWAWEDVEPHGHVFIQKNMQDGGHQLNSWKIVRNFFKYGMGYGFAGSGALVGAAMNEDAGGHMQSG